MSPDVVDKDPLATADETPPTGTPADMIEPAIMRAQTVEVPLSPGAAGMVTLVMDEGAAVEFA